MNITFTNQQRHTLARVLLAAAAVVGAVTLAWAANALPSGFTLRAEALIALLHGLLGA